MTHKQIIEKYKATFNAEVQETPEIKRALWDFIESAMNAAAQGAAEAGRVEEKRLPNKTGDWRGDDYRFQYKEELAYNAAITQSSEQLTRYFEDKEI